MQSHSPGANESDAVKEALAGVDKVGPRTYRLVNIPARKNNPDEFSVIVVGCTGDGMQAQKDVGNMMKEVDASIILHTGDVFYKHGLQFVNDNATVNERLRDVYPADKKIFGCAGNHDVDEQNIYANIYGSLTGKRCDDPLKNLCALTYYDHKDPSSEKVKAKIDFFSQDTLDISSPLMGTLNFPHPFYSVIIGERHQFIFLNTSYLLTDYINYETMKHLDPKPDAFKTNQITWLLEVMREATENNMQIALVGHHPLKPTTDRATTNNDVYEYVNDLQYQKAVQLLKLDKSKSYSLYQLHTMLFKKLEIFPFQYFAAHEHCNSIANTFTQDDKNSHPLRQVIAGGGSGKLHSRATHLTYPEISFFRRTSGFIEATYSYKKTSTFTLTVHSIDGLKHRFVTNSHLPLKPVMKDDLEKLRKCVLTACEEFSTELKKLELENKGAEIEINDTLTVTEEPVTPSTQSSSVLGLIANGLYSARKTVTDAAYYLYESAGRALAKRYRDKEFEEQLAIIQDMYAYFTQFDLGHLKFDECLQHLNTLIIKLGSKITYDPKGNFFLVVLDREIQKHFKGLSIFDLLANQPRPKN